jgi:tryptophanyl-tRNA synthetase
VDLNKARENALKYQIPAYLALGLDPKRTTFYFQSENRDVLMLAYEFAKKITLNEFKAIYGVADPGRIMSALTQVADILYPQLKKRMPGIIPVGVDQDPHIRLTRDVVARTRSKYNFIPPASINNKFMPSLDGSIKMSKSKPESFIELPEEQGSYNKKLMRALTGGRETVEIQRKLGGRPEKCMIFELYKQHLLDDDNELEDIYKRCRKGKILCGENKENACKTMKLLMDRLEQGMKKAEKMVPRLNFIKF